MPAPKCKSPLIFAHDVLYYPDVQDAILSAKVGTRVMFCAIFWRNDWATARPQPEYMEAAIDYDILNRSV